MLHCDVYLEETVNLAGFGVHVNVEVAWCGGQTRNGLDVRSKSVPKVELSVANAHEKLETELTDILRQPPSSRRESAQ